MGRAGGRIPIIRGESTSYYGSGIKTTSSVGIPWVSLGI